MALLSLPNELLIEIVECLNDQRSINSVNRVNRRFHSFFNDYLYRYNIQFRESRALLWAAQHGHESTVRKLLHLGADVEVTLPRRTTVFQLSWEPSRLHNTPVHGGVTALHLAASKGYLPIVELLLEVGADPEARTIQGRTPLYAALAYGHEKISRTISRHISNFHNCLVDSENGQTPLHVACLFGLPSSVRYFLGEGADVDARDKDLATPLHHVLNLKSGSLFVRNIKDDNVRVSLNREISDSVLEIVIILLESGTKSHFEVAEELDWRKPLSASELAACHPDKRIRALFDESYLEEPPLKSAGIRIGRSWMSSSSSEIDGARLRSGTEQLHQDETRFMSFKASSRGHNSATQRSLPSDIRSFPTLGDGSRSNISISQTYASNSPWSPSNVEHLIARFSVTDEKLSLPTPEPRVIVDPSPQLGRDGIPNLQTKLSDSPWSPTNTNRLRSGFAVPSKNQSSASQDHHPQLNPFPELSKHGPKNLSNTIDPARTLWANFGKPKTHSTIDDISTNSEAANLGSADKKSLLASKARGKGRWQSLTL